MESSVRSSDSQGPWTSLWVVALLSLVAQLALCQFFSFGQRVPISLDVDPCNLWKYAYHFPPRGEYLVLNWLGIANLPPPLNPFSLAANLPPWLFFTTYTPVIGTLALLAMAAFLRELELSRPAALFGGLIFAWQGDILPFVFPGHYGYIATWPFYALAAWGALRSQRTGHWAYALICGASCGLMVGLQPDRGAIASLLVAALFLAPVVWKLAPWLGQVRRLALCAAVALLISLAAFLALFQSFIIGVSMGGQTTREQTYKFDTQFSYGPEESLTYLVPGFFGWHTNSTDGPYWGRIGQWPGWEKKHEGTRNLNLAISTTGTVATALALLAALLLLPGVNKGWPGPHRMSGRQLLYGRVLLGCGLVALVLAWGYHTPLYRALFLLPLMDKWRNPLKWLEMTNFALVTLSAMGVQHLFASLHSDDPVAATRLRRSLLAFMDGVLVLLLLTLLASYPFTIQLAGTLQKEDYQPGAIASIMSTVHTSLFVALALMALADIMLRLLWRPDRLRNWKLENPWLHRVWQKMLEPRHLPLTLALGLAGLGVIQLAWVATQFIRPTDISILTQTSPLLEELKSQGPTVRVSVAPEDPMLNVLLQNQFADPRISCLDISAASRMPDALEAFFHALDGDRSRLWFLAGVKNLVIPQSDFADVQADPRVKANIDHVDGYMLQPTDSPNLPSHALIQFRNFLNKANFVPGAEVIPSDAAQLDRLKNPNWNPRETLLLAAPAVSPPEGAPLPPAVKSPEVTLGDYDAHRIDFMAQIPKAGYVLINDAYDPDWQVRLNGRPAPLLRADYLLRAIAVPAGVSAVTLDYVAHYRIGGLKLPVVVMNLVSDVAMLVAWIVAGLALWRSRKTVSAANS
jgi:hypothetical protein